MTRSEAIRAIDEVLSDFEGLPNTHPTALDFLEALDGALHFDPEVYEISANIVVNSGVK